VCVPADENWTVVGDVGLGVFLCVWDGKISTNRLLFFVFFLITFKQVFFPVQTQLKE
jgi:hypothetical protein